MSDLTSRRLDVDALRALRAIRLHGGTPRAAALLGRMQWAVRHKVKRLGAGKGRARAMRRAQGLLSALPACGAGLRHA